MSATEDRLTALYSIRAHTVATGTTPDVEAIDALIRAAWRQYAMENANA